MELNTQKERLLKEKEELLSELKKISIKDGEEKYTAEEVLENLDDVNDLEDQALELAEFDNNFTLTVELQAQLEAVEDALERIEKGEYGKCEVCGEDIEEKRLMVLPSATTCREHMEIEAE